MSQIVEMRKLAGKVVINHFLPKVINAQFASSYKYMYEPNRIKKLKTGVRKNRR